MLRWPVQFHTLLCSKAGVNCGEGSGGSLKDTETKSEIIKNRICTGANRGAALSCESTALFNPFFFSNTYTISPLSHQHPEFTPLLFHCVPKITTQTVNISLYICPHLKRPEREREGRSGGPGCGPQLSWSLRRTWIRKSGARQKEMLSSTSRTRRWNRQRSRAYSSHGPRRSSSPLV